ADRLQQLARQSAGEQQEADGGERAEGPGHLGRDARGAEHQQEQHAERQRLHEPRRDARSRRDRVAHGGSLLLSSPGRGVQSGSASRSSSPARTRARRSASGATTSPSNRPAAAIASTVSAAGCSKATAIETAQASVTSPVETSE